MRATIRFTRIAIPLGMVLVGVVLALVSGSSASNTVRGRLLEGCSCSVPCVCNVGGVPDSICESLAFFEIEHGSVDGIDLENLHFAIADRGNFGAAIYVDSAVLPNQKMAIRKVAQWIVSLEGTPLAEVVDAPIQLKIDDRVMSGSVGGTPNHLSGVLLSPRSFVSHPRIFGEFPVIYAEKGVSEELIAKTTEFSFSHKNTNLNKGVFEFTASKIAPEKP